MMWVQNFDGQACECEVSSLLVRLRRISQRIDVSALWPDRVETWDAPDNEQPSTILFTYQPYRRAETSHPRCDSEWGVCDLPNMRIRKYPLGELPSCIPPTARRSRLPRREELYNND